MSVIRAYIDESYAASAPGIETYRIGAALVSDSRCDELRAGLRPLLRPGQRRLHWNDESAASRRRIVLAIRGLGPMTAVVAHIGVAQRKNERARRKCLETLYGELDSLGIRTAQFESRSAAQDRLDVAHLVGLQNGVLPRTLRISHVPGGDEPLLWIADTLLGAINSAQRGEADYLEVLRETIVLERLTPGSIAP